MIDVDFKRHVADHIHMVSTRTTSSIIKHERYRRHYTVAVRLQLLQLATSVFRHDELLGAQRFGKLAGEEAVHGTTACDYGPLLSRDKAIKRVA